MHDTLGKESTRDREKQSKEYIDALGILSKDINSVARTQLWIAGLICITIGILPELDALARQFNAPSLPSVATKISLILGVNALFECYRLRLQLKAIITLVLKSPSENSADSVA